MHPYQEQLQHAAKLLISGAFVEQEELSRLETELAKLEAELSHMGRVVEFCRLNPDLDDEGIGTAVYWEAHFDVAPKADQVAAEIDGLRQSIEARRASVEALSTALLQIGKQAMSVVNGGREKSPTGRQIGTQHLRGVVWNGRNQAMHYEEAGLNEFVQKCFNTLADDFGNNLFREYHRRSLAFEVVSLLGWSDLSSFNRDLASLLQET